MSILPILTYKQKDWISSGKWYNYANKLQAQNLIETL